MKQIKQQFVSSFQELKQVHTLAITAMLIAIAVVLGFFSVQFTDFLKVGFSFLANEVTALLFGPVVGGVMAGIADFVKYLIRPTGPFFFGFTLDAMLGGVIYGVMLYRRPFTLKRIFCAKLVVMVVVNLMLNTYWLSILYGNAFAAILPVRIVKSVLLLPVETLLFYMVAKALMKTKVLVKSL